MEQVWAKLSGRVLGGQLGLRVRLFNVLAIAGTAVSGFFALFAVFTGRWGNFAICFLGAALAFGLLVYSYRSGQYQRCYIITVVGVFLVMFPAMFFTWGGYKSGLPTFFVFAVAFTCIMLEGRWAAALSALELVVYLALCYVGYCWPATIRPYSTEREAVWGIASSFLIVCLSLGAIIRAYVNIYEEQRKELEAARQKLAEENAILEQVSRLKTEFLANVSHELKTPLTVISGYAQTSTGQFAVGGTGGLSAAEKMRLISSEAERLALMVGQVLDVTHIEEGGFSISKRPCHLDEIIYDTVNTHFPILNKNANRLNIRIQEGLPEVCADPARISQVVVNLIANAIRFTAGGDITVAARQQDGWVAVRVADTGAGISPERLPYVFERYNNRGAAAGRGTGTGLGLYICRYIVQAHGGDIQVESAQNKGTTVTFRLPAVPIN